MRRRRLTRVVCATAAAGVLFAGLVVAPAHAEAAAMIIDEEVLETAREANSSFSGLHEDIVTERQSGGIEAISPLAATARVGSVFGSPPSVVVTDEAGAPLVGAPVTFVIVGDRATFEPGAGSSVGTWTVVTGLNGVATAPPVLAGSAKGSVPIGGRDAVAD